MDNKPTNMPSDAPFSNQAQKPGPSGQRGKFFNKGWNKKRGGRASGHAPGRDRNHGNQAEGTGSIASYRDAAPPQNAEPPGMDPVQFPQQHSLASIAQLAGQGDTLRHPAPNPFTAAHREFIRYQTPRYDGRGGYETAEEWLLRVQQTLHLSQSPTEHYTELATTLLDRDARHWWTSQQSHYLGGGPSIPWEWFTVMFRARFMGEKQLWALRRRFETLTQGGMTARQYGETFIRLSRYAPDLVADPQRRRSRFIQGLHPALASMVDLYQGVSIEFLMDKAEFQEGLLLRQVQARNVPPMMDGVAAVQTGPRTHPGGRCYICQAPDHWANDCPRPGPSGQQGMFFREGRNKQRKTGPPATPTPNSTVSTATSTRATTHSSTPFKTTQSKILFGPHEIDTTVTTDPSITDQWICDTRAAHPTTDGKKIVVGLDCEWKPNRVRYQDNKIALLQLCTGNRCLILQLIYMDPVPDSVKAFLLDEMITFVGVGVGEDLAKLKGHYGLKCTKSVDLKKACNAFLGLETKICKGLKGYAREILGLELEKSKSATQSNWEQWNLKEMQIRYACLDAFISYLLGCKVLEAKSD